MSDKSIKSFPDNTSKPLSVIGLKTATQNEIRDMIKFYKQKGYKVIHKTHFENGERLPYNGTITVDRRRKYLL